MKKPDTTDKTTARKTFTRSLPATALGLCHVLAGFFATAWAIARIAVIGYREVFTLGTAIGVFNYAFEASPVLLWISGIGILRGKRWGAIIAVIWAAFAIVLHVASYFIQRHFWGVLSPGFGWGDYLVMYYACGVIAVVLGGKAVRIALRELGKRATVEQWPSLEGSLLLRVLQKNYKFGIRNKQ
jgi:hypothetical protein